MTHAPDHESNTRLDLSRSLVHLIHVLRQASDDILSAKLQATGLTPRQFTLLYVISLNPGLSQSEAGAAACSDRSTIAELSQRMEKSGLIRRTRSQKDSRTAMLHLTELGQRQVARALPSVVATNDEIIQTLAEQGRDGFLESLIAIAARLSPADRLS